MISVPKVLLVALLSLAYGAIFGYWLGALVYRCM